MRLLAVAVDCRELRCSCDGLESCAWRETNPRNPKRARRRDGGDKEQYAVLLPCTVVDKMAMMSLLACENARGGC